MCYRILRPLLFLLDPERVHILALRALKFIPGSMFKKVSAPCTVMGLNFPNPVGLAAGYDRNAEYVDGLEKLGFGFIELGTVTQNPQAGHPKPRIFRIPEKNAVINRMGFYNKGLDCFVERLKEIHFSGVLGVSIVKNFETAIEDSIPDYLTCFKAVYPFADYIAVNISSPNTPGIRNIQFGSVLEELITTLKNEQKNQKRYVPIVIKVAPDLTDENIKSISKIFIDHKVDGIIATNTTVSREGVEGLKNADEQGGLSGAPLFEKNLKMVHKFHEHLGDHIPIIASGGIMSAEDAQKMIKAGASLVQIYTGLVYQGPKLVAEIAAGSDLS